MTLTARATVSIGLACDNACVFCGQRGLAESEISRDEISAALREARLRTDEVTLVGGEPTLHEALPEIIAEARTLGFEHVGVQTNGRRLARSLPLLRDAGLTDLHLSLHGGSAAAHDYHTGVPGSFVSVVAALSAARALDLDVVILTVLTRSNARGLAELAQLLASRRASAWCITVPRVRGRASELFDRVVPRLGVAMPFALHAMQVAESLQLPVFVRGAPLCVLGPFARRAIAEQPRAFGGACDGCSARPSCAGVEPEYLARFEGDELSPRDAVEGTTHAVARMFVGPGALAAPRVEAVARPRVALPMVGKVKPAHAEVARNVEKKSGAALREIFRDLYKED